MPADREQGRGKRSFERAARKDGEQKAEERERGFSPTPLSTSPSAVSADRTGLAPGGEFDLIRGFVAQAATRPRGDVTVGPGDDCAVVLGSGIALSSDMSVENVHFRRDWLAPEEIGYRAAAAALSDLAAMAARPVGVLVSLGLPASDVGGTAQRVMAGVCDAAERVGAVLLGGDVARIEGPLVIDVVVVGECPEPVLRSGARPDDEVWVTGELGGSAAAVARWLRGHDPEPDARRRFAAPEPRTGPARWLHERAGLHAMSDLSDGLAGDLAHIAAASQVAVVIDPAALPVHPAVRRLVTTVEEVFRLAAGGGEDYELAFTAPAGSIAPLREAFHREFRIALTRVGHVETGRGVHLESATVARQPLSIGGFQHFGVPLDP
jgi:thiamine-monophosphate kinase